MEAELVKLEGSISSVIFQNHENGYTVVRMKTGDGTQITVVGTLPQAVVGERIRVEGVWTSHASYGTQLELRSAERVLPDTRIGILSFLSSRTIRGIGPKLAARIVDAFGEKALDVIEHEPGRLAQIPGISEAKAAEIHNSFLAQQGLRRLAEYLNAFRLPTELAVRIYRQYGELSQAVIEDNPYALTAEEIGASFSLVDQFALELGLEGCDSRRVEAGILYELSYNSYGGHVFIPFESLLSVTASFLHLETDVIRDGLLRLQEQEQIVIEPVAGLDAVYLPAFAEAERSLAAAFLEMVRRPAKLPVRLDELILEVEAAQSIQYASQQREALYQAAVERLLLITGGPGTGKTTILKGILDLFERLRIKTLLAAPTGRAAKRLSELTGRDASTIHRLLEVAISGDGEMIFVHNEHNRLSCDAVIVDESSMVDVLLMHDLVRALPANCRLILVGDPDQLPSVGPGSVFSDLIRSERIATVRLTEVFRQAQQSLIIMNAHRINHGEEPELDSRRNDFFFLGRGCAEAVCDTIVDLCRRRLPDKLGLEAEDIQVLTPTRKGDTGTRTLNKLLQNALNPPAKDKAEKKYGDFAFRVGDRVMQIRNNYDIIWTKPGESGAGSGIFNGDVGIIRSIDNEAQTLTIRFDDREAVYPFELLPQLEPAYAMTVHKSQGSEYKAVILCAWNGPAPLLSRSVLYTAVTRARELLIVVGSRDVVRTMVHNDKRQKRFSGLRWRLRSAEI